MATEPTYLQTNQLHRAPAFSLVIDGRDISKRVEPRLVQLTLTESRGDEAEPFKDEGERADGNVFDVRIEQIRVRVGDEEADDRKGA